MYSLKLYGRLAKIPEQKLNLMALRRTATRLWLDEGDSVEEMQSFLGSRSLSPTIRYRLARLPQLPQGAPEPGEQAPGEIPPLDRRAKPFRPGEGLIHGLYAVSQPPEEVAAVLAENIQEIGEEIVGMRALGRGLLERLSQASSSTSGSRPQRCLYPRCLAVGGDDRFR